MTDTRRVVDTHVAGTEARIGAAAPIAHPCRPRPGFLVVDRLRAPVA